MQRRSTPSLVGDTLLSVLSQLRAGYQERPDSFPQSVVLCSMSDIREHCIRSATGEVTPVVVPFNVAAKALRLRDFTEAETMALMAQHTEETGQPFTATARDAVLTHTQGQPGLVNALCAGACFDAEAGRDRSRVRRVVGPILNGKQPMYSSEDLAFARALGLIDDGRPPRIANPIYQELVPQELSHMA